MPLRGLAYLEVAEVDFPVQITALPGSRYAYVVARDGRIWAYDGTTLLPDPVLDIRARVSLRSEQGLLSAALDPGDPGRLFVHYTDVDGDTVVSEFEMTSPVEALPGSETVHLRVDQPARNHNGGMITFGPDGALYVGLGDGGGGGDRFGNGQNRDTLLGGLVRIDVDDVEADATLFQYGLRNPWRFWLDGGLVYVADVGQGSFEEVSVGPFEPDVNYGWPITEGLHCYRPASGCDMTGITLPVVEMAHGDEGTCSVTGGIVYRGEAIPELVGHYFYSDYCGGYLRSFRYRRGEVVAETDWTGQVGVPGRVVGFGVDGTGEMYVATTERLLQVVADRG